MATSQKRPRDEHGEVVEVIEYNYERFDKLPVLGLFFRWFGFVVIRNHFLLDRFCEFLKTRLGRQVLCESEADDLCDAHRPLW